MTAQTPGDGVGRPRARETPILGGAPTLVTEHPATRRVHEGDARDRQPLPGGWEQGSSNPEGVQAGGGSGPGGGKGVAVLVLVADAGS